MFLFAFGQGGNLQSLWERLQPRPVPGSAFDVGAEAPPTKAGHLLSRLRERPTDGTPTQPQCGLPRQSSPRISGVRAAHFPPLAGEAATSVLCGSGFSRDLCLGPSSMSGLKLLPQRRAISSPGFGSDRPIAHPFSRDGGCRDSPRPASPESELRISRRLPARRQLPISVGAASAATCAWIPSMSGLKPLPQRRAISPPDFGSDRSIAHPLSRDGGCRDSPRPASPESELRISPPLAGEAATSDLCGSGFSRDLCLGPPSMSGLKPSHKEDPFPAPTFRGGPTDSAPAQPRWGLPR